MNPADSTLSRDELTARQWDRIRQLLARILPRNRFWQNRFASAGLDPRDLRGIDDLRHLPCTAKADFVADQEMHPPYGTNLTFPLEDYSRLHQTSGTTSGLPLRWLDTAESWTWMLDCWRQIYQLMGLAATDRLCFPFSFGPFLGFWAGFEGALRQGNLCIAAGGMSSEARLKLIEDNQITILGCTPTYALRLAETAKAQGVALAASSVRALLVAGEPGGNIPSTRERITQAWGARVFDHWGMTEIGPLASEAEDDPGCLTVLESECLPEVINPNTGQHAAPGEIGELVITNFGRVGSPVLRYRTGDLVQTETSPHPSGRSWLRLKGGILGRTDDMLLIRGNNDFPAGIEAVIREFAEVEEFRLVVSRRREMDHLRIEIEPTADLEEATLRDLASRVGRTIKDRLNFQAEIVTVAAGTLPRFEMKARRLVRE
jgi:phenylacetate-CoA ligase